MNCSISSSGALAFRAWSSGPARIISQANSYNKYLSFPIQTFSRSHSHSHTHTHTETTQSLWMGQIFNLEFGMLVKRLHATSGHPAQSTNFRLLLMQSLAKNNDGTSTGVLATTVEGLD